MWALSVALALAARAGGEPVAILCVAPQQALANRVHAETVRLRIVEQLPGANAGASTTATLLRALTGLDAPKRTDADALGRMLSEARELEARFDPSGAAQVRDTMLAAAAQSIRPSARIRRLEAAALHDAAAAALAAAAPQRAESYARDALRRFPGVGLEQSRHPPSVQELFARVATALGEEPSGKLHVHTDAPAIAFANGRRLGRVAEDLEVALPAGTYQVWLQGSTGSQLSLRHQVHVHAKATTRANIDFAIERRLHPGPPLVLRSASACVPAARALQRRIAPTPLAVVQWRPRAGARACRRYPVAIFRTDSPTPSRHRVSVCSRASQPLQVRLLATPQPRFSPLYLLPFGGGQFAQQRPFMGSSFAAVQLGLAGWHALSFLAHRNALRQQLWQREPRWRLQRNVSAGLLYGAIAVGILEAVAVGWLRTEPP